MLDPEMGEEGTLNYYDSNNLVPWLGEPPVGVLASVVSGLRRSPPLGNAYTEMVIKHPNVDSVSIFDGVLPMPLKEYFLFISDKHDDLYKYLLIGMKYWDLCDKNPATITYETRYETDLEFKIDETINGLHHVNTEWDVWPSPIAVLYTLCQHVISTCNEIQDLTEPLFHHTEFNTEKRLDRSEKMTFCYIVRVLRHNSEVMKRIARLGLAYREAFLMGEVKLSPEELKKSR